jgi:hypothetical protein
MGNSMSDIYGAMFQKHVNQPSPIYDLQTPAQSQPTSNISESVISAFSKKSDKDAGKKASLVSSLIQIKESIDKDPRTAKTEIEKLIIDIQK